MQIRWTRPNFSPSLSSHSTISSTINSIYLRTAKVQWPHRQDLLLCEEAVKHFFLFCFVFARWLIQYMVNPVLLRGVVPPPTVFALVLKIAQPRGKIAPGTFKFIFPFILEKNSEPTTYTGGRVSFQSWEVGGGVGAIPWFLNWIFWKYLKWYALTSLFAS